ncbi:hypothetical protein HZ996_05760 [Cryomorphaceae bacterium]|nr:hypothetical protein HZ996_05760 [Cryomorphaceae bacterium]
MKKVYLLLTFAAFCSLASCSSPDTPATESTQSSETDAPEATEAAYMDPMSDVERPEHHSYGGWYCPDNLTGFPPVDVSDLSSVKVVTDRLPTKEETRNGTSLMYINTSEYPDAKPIDLGLPRLARYYNKHTRKNELIVVIQGLAVAGDSVVGFRYVNGGNGSAWLDEVDFLNPMELANQGATPFFFREVEMGGTTKSLWNVITGHQYSSRLGNHFAPGAHAVSDYKQGSRVHVYVDSVEVATGTITALWPETYMQIDYDFGGIYYVEKYLMMGAENGAVKLQVASGPFGADAADQLNSWNNWFDDVVQLTYERDKEDDC